VKVLLVRVMDEITKVSPWPATSLRDKLVKPPSLVRKTNTLLNKVSKVPNKLSNVDRYEK
jgi:hypothetical protein